MPDLRLLKVHIPSIPQLPLVIGLFFPSLFRPDDVLCLLDNPQLIRLRSARPLSPIRELSTIASSFLLMLLSRHSLSSPIARARISHSGLKMGTRGAIEEVPGLPFWRKEILNNIYSCQSVNMSSLVMLMSECFGHPSVWKVSLLYLLLALPVTFHLPPSSLIYFTLSCYCPGQCGVCVHCCVGGWGSLSLSLSLSRARFPACKRERERERERGR